MQVIEGDSYAHANRRVLVGRASRGAMVLVVRGGVEVSKRRYISERKLSELTELAGGVFGSVRLSEIVAPFVYFDHRMRYVVRRKALWAALHNALNVGHPKGPRKPHKWTVK